MRPTLNGGISGVVVLPVAAIAGTVVWLVDKVLTGAAGVVLLVVHGSVDGADVDDIGTVGCCSI